MKTCLHCGVAKDTGAFYAKASGVDSWCKECRRADTRAYYLANKAECDRKRVERARNNRVAENLRKREWAKANPVVTRSARLVWADKNKSKDAARRAKYQRDHKEQGAAKSARWRKKHPEKKRALDTVRAARRRAARGAGVRAQEWLDIKHAQCGVCAYCSRPARLTMDHIEPLVSGGAHEPGNITAVCRSCNSSKNDTPLLVWLARKVA